MTTNQPTLWMAPKRTEDTEARVAQLCARLVGRGWIRAREFKTLFHYSDRTLRFLASESKGRIISGQKGYCLFSEASDEDVLHAAAWLRHQGREMIERSVEIERMFHRRGPVVTPLADTGTDGGR